MALGRPRSKGKTLGGCLTLVAVIAAVLLFGTFVRDLFDTPFNPWAHSWRGGPTLTGTWVGSVNSPSGRAVGVFLDLRRARTGRRNNRYSMCRTCPRIEGAARVCGGGAQSYEVWGGPDTWGGEQFHLSARQDGPERAALGLRFLRGEWEGDALKIATKFEGGGQGAGAEVRFEMRRGTEAEFLDACRKSGADWSDGREGGDAR